MNLNQDLISKKELLEITGISYGQLYRWKRKNLIPEDWFVRKSTFTGQETFFPRQKIVDRIEKIKNMKGDLSLDDLADMLSPELSMMEVEGNTLIENEIVSSVTLDYYIEKYGETGKYTFEDMISLYILEKMFKSGKISFEEGNIVLELLKKHYSKFKGRSSEIIFFRKIGVSSCCLVSDSKNLYFDDEVRIVESMNITELIEELKIKLV